MNTDRMASPGGTLRDTGIFEGEKYSCTGEGGYAGLSAILTPDFTNRPRSVEGLIFPGEMPPMPEVPSSK